MNLDLRRDYTSDRAFTLIEVLIVVVILGILGALVIAGVTDASAVSKESALKESLIQMRTQISFYAAHHHDVLPPDGETLARVLTSRTDEFGNIGATAAHRYGPYLSSMPHNPFNGNDLVADVAGGGTFTADGSSSGWLYQVNGDAFVFKGNTLGQDVNGRRYLDY